jgi:hypothetical protein
MLARVRETYTVIVLRKKLKELSQSSIVFSRQNRYDKYRIHKLLYANLSLRKYLPESIKYSKEELQAALKKYSPLFIKPTNSSDSRSHPVCYL